jgi:hypothetical protein
MEIVLLLLLGFLIIALPAMFLFMALLDAIFGEDAKDHLLHQEDYEPKNAKR